MFIGSSPEFVKKKTHRTGGAEFRDRWRTFSGAGSRISGDHTPGSAPVPRAGKGGNGQNLQIFREIVIFAVSAFFTGAIF
jgi:hypothetical protein